MSFVPVYKKELKSYFTSPVIYTVLTVFLAIAGYFFYSNILMIVLLQGSSVRVNLWEYTFNDMRFIMILLLPLITMRLFAEEKKHGTIELLFTSPLRDREIVWGKYCACLSVLATIFVLTLLYPLLFKSMFYVDVGPVVAAYLGLFLLGATFLSCGLFVSSLTENQIVAAIGTFGVLVSLWFVENYQGAEGLPIIDALTRLSFQKHFYSFKRGVINTKDIIYFVTVCLFFIFLTLKTLDVRKRTPISVTGTLFGISFKKPDIYWFVFTGKLLLFVCVFLFVNVAGNNYNRRFDLTPGRFFSLAPASYRVLGLLKDEMKLTVFCEREQQFRYEELLGIIAASSQNFSYKLVNISRNPVQAKALGIDSGGAGIAEYRQRREVLQSVNEASVVKSILTLTMEQQKTIRCLGRFEDTTRPAGYGDVRRLLNQRGFIVEKLTLNAAGDVPDDTLILLAVVSRDDVPQQVLQALERFLEKGGRVLVFLEQGPVPRVSRFLARYNVDVGDDIVIDRNNTAAGFDEQTPLVLVSRWHTISQRVTAPVIAPRFRSVQVGSGIPAGLSWTILAQSSKRTWAESDLESADNGTARYDSETKDVYGPVPVGVVVENKGAYEKTLDHGKMIVIGNASFINNEYLGTLANRDFFLSMTSWLGEKKDVLAELEMQKAVAPAPPIRLTQTATRLLFWLAVVIEPLLMLILGAAVVLWRKTYR